MPFHPHGSGVQTKMPRCSVKSKFRFVFFDVDSTLVTIEGIDVLANGNPEVVRLTEALLPIGAYDPWINNHASPEQAWTMFRRVTLPNIKWGLLYGVLLCSARAMGEFGAVSVVSGHIRGLTNTLPLHIEILYNEFDSTAAFAAASLLAGLALVTLVLKFWLEARHGDALAQSHRRH